MKITAVVFDLDNTLLLDPATGEGSEEIKDRAWYRVFSEYNPGLLKPVLENAQKRVMDGNGDRQDIAKEVLLAFRYSVNNLEQESLKRCDYFDQIVQEEITKLGISQDVKNFLNQLVFRYPLFLNSSTPVESVTRTLKSLDIYEHFTEVYGRPGTKYDNLLEIIARSTITARPVLCVDDSEAGYLAASAIGCQFIGIRTKRNKIWHQRINPFPTISSVLDLEPLLF
jgi:phosphoglycolate phosphatase-like HAD superfamily hydrolase